MFDPGKWAAASFESAATLAVGQRRTITMTLAAGAVVWIANVYYANNDTGAQTVILEYEAPSVPGFPSPVSQITIPAAVSRNLLPVIVGVTLETRLAQGFMAIGPCVVTLRQVTAQTTLRLMTSQISWFQARFTAQDADEIVPVVVDA